MSELKKKPETLVDKARQAAFPKLSFAQDVVDIVPLTENIDLELRGDGSVTWVPTQKEEEEKDGD